MTYVIATDEAGLGPNLGPLVVSATVWQLADGLRAEELFKHLGEAVVATAAEAVDGRIAVADSKKLYQPGGTIRHLERGVLVGLMSLGLCPTSWRGLFDVLDPSAAQARATIPWYAGYDESVPTVPGEEDLAHPSERFLEVCRKRDIRLCGMQSRVLDPLEYNDRLAACGGKGALLSDVTLGLAAELAEPLEGAILIVCDKHGGRNHYADLLARHFPDAFIEIHGESRDLSAYRFGPATRRIDARFRTRAESYLPVGLASMISKYLRELSMRPFNQFWARHVEGLRPTAGYPQDAKRFKMDIAAAQQVLGIANPLLWRQK